MVHIASHLLSTDENRWDGGNITAFILIWMTVEKMPWGQQESLDKRKSEGKETCLSWATQRKRGQVQGREQEMVEVQDPWEEQEMEELNQNKRMLLETANLVKWTFFILVRF